MQLNELRDTSHEIAKSKGWHDDDLKRSFADLMALVISELAEALEEYRACRPAIRFPQLLTHDGDAMARALEGYKPEGVAVELADALIRIGDCAGAYELHLGEGTVAGLANTAATWEDEATSFGYWFCRVCASLLQAECAEKATVHTGDEASFLVDAVWRITRMAAWLGVGGDELEEAVKIKHAYNRTRPHRHGGKIL